ncbi:topoisomerase (DNA) II binding protein 1 [Pelomyxa schiedti]|nr:topoisomerase (DNA) II binding protein 1 [Pelomyxa schiedti]
MDDGGGGGMAAVRRRGGGGGSTAGACTTGGDGGGGDGGGGKVLVVTLSGQPVEEKEKITRILKSRGVHLEANLTEECRLVIASTWNSGKVLKAFDFDIPVVHTQWLYRWASSTSKEPPPIDKWLIGPALPLQGCTICTSNMSPDNCEEVYFWCQLLGASFTEEYSDAVTHLIVGRPSGDIFQAASKSATWVLSIDWLKKCTDERRRVTEDPFSFAPELGEDFLLGLKICIVGFNKTQTEDLRKMALKAGATVPEGPLDGATHIIVAQTNAILPEVACVQDHVFVVIADWLLQSYAKKEKLLEKHYTPSIYSVEHTCTVEAKPPSAKRPRVDRSAEGMALASCPSPPPSTPPPQSSNTGTDNDQCTPGSQICMPIVENSVFEGKKFFLWRLPDVTKAEQVRLFIKTCGGIELTRGAEAADYIVSSHGSQCLPTGVKMKKPVVMVTLEWLDRCYKDKKIVDPKQSVLYTPLGHTIPSDIGKALITCASSLDTVNMREVKHLTFALGGKFNATFSKNHTTHLISGQACGRKYEAAIKWGIPVVSLDWLTLCVMKGELLETQSFEEDLKNAHKMSGTENAPQKGTKQILKEPVGQACQSSGHEEEKPKVNKAREDQEKMEREQREQQERTAREAQERVEKERMEKERIEKETRERLKKEEEEKIQREERERIAQEEKERIAQEEKERMAKERERIAKEEREKIQREERERLEMERNAQEQKEKKEREEREERERLEKEEKERLERERIKQEQETAERRRLERERLEREEKEKREKEEQQKKLDDEELKQMLGDIQELMDTVKNRELPGPLPEGRPPPEVHHDIYALLHTKDDLDSEEATQMSSPAPELDVDPELAASQFLVTYENPEVKKKQNVIKWKNKIRSRQFVVSKSALNFTAQLQKIITKIGGTIVPKVLDRKTILIAANFDSSEQMFSACAAGCWVVSPSYIVDQGTKPKKIEHELCETNPPKGEQPTSPNAGLPRLCRTEVKEKRKPRFHRENLHLLLRDSKVESSFRCILTAGGAIVTAGPLPTPDKLSTIARVLVDSQTVKDPSLVVLRDSAYTIVVHKDSVVDSLWGRPLKPLNQTLNPAQPNTPTPPSVQMHFTPPSGPKNTTSPSKPRSSAASPIKSTTTATTTTTNTTTTTTNGTPSPPSVTHTPSPNQHQKQPPAQQQQQPQPQQQQQVAQQQAPQPRYPRSARRKL